MAETTLWQAGRGDTFVTFQNSTVINVSNAVKTSGL